MPSQSRVRTGRILLVLFGVSLLLDAFQVIQLPWPYLWPVILLVGGVAMIRWVARPTYEKGAPRPAGPAQAGRGVEDHPAVLKIARAMIGLFVRS